MELGALLAAVEEAAPAGVADSLGQELVRTVAADHVALLIANFSGSALVRLSHVSGADVDRHGRNGRAETVPLPGTVYEIEYTAAAGHHCVSHMVDTTFFRAWMAHPSFRMIK